MLCVLFVAPPTYSKSCTSVCLGNQLEEISPVIQGPPINTWQRVNSISRGQDVRFVNSIAMDGQTKDSTSLATSSLLILPSFSFSSSTLCEDTHTHIAACIFECHIYTQIYIYIYRYMQGKKSCVSHAQNVFFILKLHHGASSFACLTFWRDGGGAYCCSLRFCHCHCYTSLHLAPKKSWEVGPLHLPLDTV